MNRAMLLLRLVNLNNVCLSVSVHVCVSVCPCLSVCVCPVSLLLCHQHVQSAGALNEMWRQALQSGFIMTLCRDEVLYIHAFIMAYFDTVRGYVSVCLCTCLSVCLSVMTLCRDEMLLIHPFIIAYFDTVHRYVSVCNHSHAR